MATVNGNTADRWRAVLDYTTETSESSVSITAKISFQSIANGFSITTGISGSLTINGQTSSFSGKGFSSAYGQTKKTVMLTKTVSVARGSSSKKVTVSGTVKNTSGFRNGTSTASASVTIPALTPVEPEAEVPGTPTAVSATRNSDTKITVKWTNHANEGGIDDSYIQVNENDEGWTDAGSVSGTTATYAYNNASANSKYQFRVCSENEAGTSSYSSATSAIYTTPAAPTGAMAQRLDSTAYLTAILGDTLYPGTVQWQYSSNNSTWSSVSSTGAAATHNTSSNLYYRCRVGSVSGGLYSAYGPSTQATALQRIYVNVPDGKTPSAVYINK